MAIAAICAGVLILFIVLRDTFETVVLPRTVTRKLRLTRVFYLLMWRLCTAIAKAARLVSIRNSVLYAFGPMSLLLLLMLWGTMLIAAGGLIQWGVAALALPALQRPTFGADLYMSASTFVTLGFGGPSEPIAAARYVAVTEAGLGLGFLAIVIGYLPVIYQSFSRREVGISLLDARAGSPPAGGELLRRYAEAGQLPALCDYLAEWERWASDTLESHLSYPVLAFYRSQHDRESWVAALAAILDACALLIIGIERTEPWQQRLVWQAQLTYAMARHTVIDLALIFRIEPTPPVPDRLPHAKFQALTMALREAGLPICIAQSAEEDLARFRAQYEPHINAIADRMILSLPLWLPEEKQIDNWQTSVSTADDHFHQ